ncbi:hypothetical protein TNCV_4873781 [Trichonephila clavipes]|nr:hypothetical protein TNCV_4873781 [Trichonephila clavipes]
MSMIQLEGTFINRTFIVELQVQSRLSQTLMPYVVYSDALLTKPGCLSNTVDESSLSLSHFSLQQDRCTFGQAHDRDCLLPTVQAWRSIRSVMDSCFMVFCWTNHNLKENITGEKIQRSFS